MITLEWPLSCVSPHVSCQIGGCKETLITLHTPKISMGLIMNHFCPIKVNQTTKTAYLLKWFVSLMSTQMYFKI